MSKTKEGARRLVVKRAGEIWGPFTSRATAEQTVAVHGGWITEQEYTVCRCGESDGFQNPGTVHQCGTCGTVSDTRE